MAGTINLSMSQQFDMDGEPLSGGLLYFFAAGTTDPQNAYQDFGLTIVHPNPIVLDASGRVPSFYLADGFIKIRLTDENGVTVIAADQLLVIGPSTGTGGGAGVDANTVLQTGDIKVRFDTLPRDGFVICNGTTIGAVLSPATQRRNADCQELFEFLWLTTVLTVLPVRGTGSAHDDWLANKHIATPDLRGRTIAGLDAMGGSPASRLTTSFFASADSLGTAAGFEANTLDATQIPGHTHNYTPVGTVAAMPTPNHKHAGDTLRAALSIGGAVNVRGVTPGAASAGVAGGSDVSVYSTAAFDVIQQVGAAGWTGLTGFENSTHGHDFNGTLAATAQNVGGGLGHANVQPTMVMTFYIKL